MVGVGWVGGWCKYKPRGDGGREVWMGMGWWVSGWVGGRPFVRL